MASHTGGLRLPPKRIPAITRPPSAASKNRTTLVCNRVWLSIGSPPSSGDGPMEYPSGWVARDPLCKAGRATATVLSKGSFAIGLVYRINEINRFEDFIRASYDGRRTPFPPTHEDIRMALINTPIKPFKAQAFKDGKFIEVSDADLKGKWSVVVFYPADFTFVCPTELEDLAEHYDEFQKLGVEVYSVSTDTHFSHK